VNRLDFQSLCIEELDVDAFVGLDASELTEIHLGDNYIRTVPAGTLRNLSRFDYAAQLNIFRRYR